MPGYILIGQGFGGGWRVGQRLVRHNWVVLGAASAALSTVKIIIIIKAFTMDLDTWIP